MSRLDELKAKVGSALKAEPAPALETAQPEADQTATTQLTSALDEIGRILDTSAKVEMSLLRSADGKDAAWLVISDTTPMARIVLSKQDDPSKIASYFVTAEYRSTILDAGKKLGWAKTLPGCKAEIISDGWIVQAAEPEVNVDEVRRQTIREFSQAADLVIKAFAKNLIDPNPLKAALYDVFSEAKVANPQARVEQVFDQGGEELISAIIGKATEWMNLKREAREQLVSMIGDMDRKAVSAQEAGEEAENDLAAQLEANSVPLTTSAREGNSFRERVRAAFGK